jgi:uncharacterized UBP type Zn finger protein
MEGRALSLNGSAPRCEHLDAIRPVTVQPGGCGDCEATGDSWVRLFVCLTCGFVACSDDSPQRHALAHYRETDHPIAGLAEPGSTWKWCYVHGRAV